MDTINSAIGECYPIPRLQVAARTAQAPPVGEYGQAIGPEQLGGAGHCRAWPSIAWPSPSDRALYVNSARGQRPA